MAGENDKDKKVNEPQPQPPVFEVSESVVFDFRAKPKEYVFNIADASSDNTTKKKITDKTQAIKRYDAARRHRNWKYNLRGTAEDWSNLRFEERRIENDYQQDMATIKENADTARKNATKDSQKALKDTKKRLEDQRDARIRNVESSVMERFPKPKLRVKFLGEGEQAPASSKTEKTVSFTKLQFDNLKAIKENKRSFMGFKLKQSPEFASLQSSIESFTNDFGQVDSLGDDKAAAIKKATDMMASLARVKTDADKYIEKYKNTKYSSACNARKAMAQKAASMAEKKIAELMRAVESYDIATDDISRERQDAIEAETKLANEEFQQKTTDAERESQEKLEAELRAIQTQQENTEQHAANRREGRYGEVNLKRREYAIDQSRPNHEYANEAFEIAGNVGYADYSLAPPKYQTIMSELKIAKLIFAEDNNPFTNMNDDPFTENNEHQVIEDFDKAIYGDKVHDDQMNFNELKKTIEEKAPGMKLAYSPKAMLTLSNLNLFDYMTGAKRNPGEYDASISFVKDGVTVPVDNIKNVDFAKMQKEGYSCVIDNVKADMLYEKDGKLFNFAKGKGSMLNSMIAKETFNNIMVLDKESINFALPSLVTGAPNTPAEFLGETLEAYREDINKKNKLNSQGQRKTTSMNVFSESKIADQLGKRMINFESLDPQVVEDELEENVARDVLNTRYFDADVLRNSADIIVPKKKYTPLDMKSVVAQRSTENSLTFNKDSNYSPEFENFLNNNHQDPKLQKISSDIKTLRAYGPETLKQYDTKYIGYDTIFDEDPGEDENCLEFASDTNKYNTKAYSLFKDINSYIKDNENQLAQKDSPASMLSTWKDKVFPQGKLNTDKLEDNAIFINAAATGIGFGETVFNGDLEYLTSMNVDSAETDPFPDYDRIADEFDLGNRSIKLKDFSKEPLFTKAPSVSDIKDGVVCNRALFSVLKNVVDNDPSQIYDMIKDNDDGTVTCKFFNSKQDPVYVKVSKQLAVHNYDSEKVQQLPNLLVSAQDTPLWVQLMEKAYMLSPICSEYMKLDNRITDANKNLYLSQYKDNAMQAEVFAKGHPEDDGEAYANSYINQNKEALYSRSKFAVAQLNPRDIQETITGKRVHSKTINDMNGNEIFDTLSYKIANNKILTDSYNLFKIAAIGKDERPDALLPGQKILSEAVKRLKATSAVNQPNKKVPYGAFYLEDLLDSIDAVVRETPGELKGYMQRDLDLAGTFLSSKIKEYNMHDLTPGTHLVSKRKGNYSDYANSIFDNVSKRRSRGDQVTCTMMDSKDHRYIVEDCKIRGGLKVLFLKDPTKSHEPNGGIIEMELNDFVQQTKQLDFEIGKGALNKDEVMHDVAKGVLQVARKKYSDVFEKNIDPVMGEDEKINVIIDSPVIANLSDKIMAHAEYMEQIKNGEDISKALENIDNGNLENIKTSLQQAASPDALGLRERAREKKWAQEVLKRADDMQKALDSGSLKGDDAKKAREWLKDSEKELKELQKKVDAYSLKRNNYDPDKQTITPRMKLQEKIRSAQANQIGDGKEALRAKNGKFEKFLLDQSRLQNKKFGLKDIEKLLDEHGSEYDLSTFNLPNAKKPALKPGEMLKQDDAKMEQLRNEESSLKFTGEINLNI